LPPSQPGDELLVDVADSTGRLRDGVYLLRIDGMVQVRRLTLHPVRLEVTVQSDNPAYADWPGLKPGELELVGRVVWTGRRLA
jgi:phage repressor protein C with HTH and peptisase S24 domain